MCLILERGDVFEATTNLLWECLKRNGVMVSIPKNTTFSIVEVDSKGRMVYCETEDGESFSRSPAMLQLAHKFSAIRQVPACTPTVGGWKCPRD